MAGTGFNFASTPATAAAANPSGTGFAFGANKPATTTVPGFGLGTVAPTLGLGGTTTATTSTGAGFGFGLGAQTTASSNPAFGGMTFGVNPTTGSLTISNPANTQSTGFSLGSFGAATTSSAAPTFGGFAPSSTGTLVAGTSTAPATGGLFGVVPGKSLLGSTSLASTGLGGVPTTSVGLGGIDASQNKFGLANTTSGRPENKSVKENLIPNEIIQTIEEFKNFVKDQKNTSSDIAHGSTKPLYKVQSNAESLKNLLNVLKNGLTRNTALVEKLKADTATEMQNAEMAQRTHDTPLNLQLDNAAPLEYFMKLVARFEEEMQFFRQEIERTERHIQSLSQSTALTPQELAQALQRLHASLIALAGKLHSVHTSVETQKQQYLNLRKYFLRDNRDVFEEQRRAARTATDKSMLQGRVAPGPTPFTAGSHLGLGISPPSSSVIRPPIASVNPLGYTSASSDQMLNTSCFTAGSASTAWESGEKPFQLQRPPPGHKRGKR